MPIYEYVCAACGLERDMMQKVSDPAFTHCPQCGAQAFQKKISAAGFQLKGSGWYVTDFRDKNKKDKPASGTAESAKDGTSAGASEKPAAASAPAAAAPAG